MLYYIEHNGSKWGDIWDLCITADIGDLWDLCNTADIIFYSLPSLNRLALFVRIFFGK